MKFEFQGAQDQPRLGLSPSKLGRKVATVPRTYDLQAIVLVWY